MGLLVDGVWHDRWYGTTETGGRFVRQESQFRHQISESGRFSPEAGRYHLYVSLACPWAHRTLIFRKLKRLEDLIGVSVVDPLMFEHGWRFSDTDARMRDHLFRCQYLYQIYLKADARYSGRVTVPVLWDTKENTIVNNESSEIIRMFNSAFDGAGGDATRDFCPEDLKAEIDRINTIVYDAVNNGVYKCGFATTQDAYEEAFDALFKTLDDLDARLAQQRYLVGNTLTEADWRLFTTLVRFDAVYVGHFKCNQQRISDYDHLSNYLRDLYQVPGVAETVDLKQIKEHYYRSHETINPTRVVPKGPQLDLDGSHDRDRFASR